MESNAESSTNEIPKTRSKSNIGGGRLFQMALKGALGNNAKINTVQSRKEHTQRSAAATSNQELEQSGKKKEGNISPRRNSSSGVNHRPQGRNDQSAFCNESERINHSKPSDNCVSKKSAERFVPLSSSTPQDLKNITQTIRNKDALNQSSSHNEVMWQDCLTSACLNGSVQEKYPDLKNISRTVKNEGASNRSSSHESSIEETYPDLKKITRTIKNEDASNRPSSHESIEETYPDLKEITRTFINENASNRSCSHNQAIRQHCSINTCLNESIEIASDTASAVDSGICCDEPPDISSTYSNEQLSAISLLLKEIEKQRHSPEDHGASVCRDVDRIIRRYFKGCCCKLYGSYKSGFAIENSDINIELCTDGNAVTTKFLNEVQKILTREKANYFVNFQSSIKLMDCCITLIEPENGTLCKLKYLINNYDTATSELLKELCFQNPYVKTLIIALRHWAEICSIHEVENGGLRALGYALMVIHFLQQHNPPVLPIVCVKRDKNDRNSYSIPILNGSRKPSVPELWLSLFEYYSSFNWRDHVINITSIEPILKTSTAWQKCWIGIQAPLDSKINIAKSVISPDISQFIQMCFMQTFKYFSKATGTCAKQLSDDEIQSINADEGFEILSEISEYKYCFNKFNFTEGIDSPQFCPECEELGYQCEDCSEESNLEVNTNISLPNIDDKFKKDVTNALTEAFEEYMLKAEEVKKRIQLVSTIENYIRKKFRNAKLKLMGSTVNGFGFQKSDLDICLTFENTTIEKINVFDIIRQLRQHLRRNRDFSSVLAIFGAKIPLVQFVHQETGLRGDLSLYNLLAVENTELLYSYSVIDKRVRILGCAMKLLAKNAGISDTADRSLSSYSYILMVIHYLQRTNPPILPALQELTNKTSKPKIVEGWDTSFFNHLNGLGSVWEHKQNDESAGELWFGLLKYYTEDLDSQTVISIRDSKPPLIKNADIKTARLFNIQDPFILSKNLGAVMSDSMSVKTLKTLLRSRKLLSNSCTQVPTGFRTLKEYLFDPMNLTDGRISKVIECDLCGKLGHRKELCARYNFNFARGRGRPWANRGYHSNYRSSVAIPMRRDSFRNGNTVGQHFR